MKNIQKMGENKFTVPTEEISLPSKGVLYSKENPLSSGKIEMKYMTAKEEDILTNQNYIQKGVVLDKLLESMIVGKIDISDILLGDKNALLIATRILGYGKDYTFKSYGDNQQLVDVTVDLTELDEKPLLTDTIINPGENNFKFTLPSTGTEVTYRLLTHKDEKKIEQEIDGHKKLYPNSPSPDLSTRMKHMITSVGGDSTQKTIREFVDKALIARDSKALREEYKRISPDVKMVSKKDGQEGINIPIGVSFFWPQ